MTPVQKQTLTALTQHTELRLGQISKLTEKSKSATSRYLQEFIRTGHVQARSMNGNFYYRITDLGRIALIDQDA